MADAVKNAVDDSKRIPAVTRVETSEEDLQKGMDEYEKLERIAEDRASRLSEELVKQILEAKDNDKYNMTLAILTISKTLTHLASFLYEDENSFLEEMKRARTAIPTDVIPALLDPKPCGNCPECQNGNPEGCVAPIVRAEMTTSRIIPVIASMLVEYDLFNKIIWMHTVGKDEAEAVKAAAVNKTEENNDIPKIPD